MTTLIPKFEQNNSTVNRPINFKLQETVSVKDFGAKGDGTTDDTLAIQAALNSTFTNGGGCVYMPSGTYIISSPLIVRSNTILNGSGPSTIVKQTANSHPEGNVIHIGYGYEWNQNGQKFNSSSNNDATITQLVANNFTNLTTTNAGVSNLTVEGTATNPGLGVWFMNALNSYCENIWAINTLTPVNVANDAPGWQAGCVNISVKNIFQISCVNSTGNSWYDLLFIGSGYQVNASYLFNNPNTPANLYNKIVTAGAVNFTISNCVIYGTGNNADVGINVGSNSNINSYGGNIFGNVLNKCTTGIGVYKNTYNIYGCNVHGNIFNSCYVGLEVDGYGQTIGSNNFNNSSYADFYTTSAYNAIATTNYNYGTWYLGTVSQVTNPAAAVMYWNSANNINGLALVDADSTSVGRYSAQFVRNNNLVGSIQTTLTATSYATSSDYRLKNNPQPINNSGVFIDSLKPTTWTWSIDGTVGAGFLAHEVQEISPSSVNGIKDAVQDIGEITDETGKIIQQNVVQPSQLPSNQVWKKTGTQPVYQSMEYGSAEFIANIVAELQSLRARLKAANIA